MTRYVDNYDRADGPVGNDWTEIGSSGAFAIANNRLVAVNGTSNVRFLRYARALSSSDQKVGQMMYRGNSGSHGLVVRSNADMSRLYGIRTTSNAVQMFRTAGGTTLLGPTQGAWSTAGAFVELGIQGTTLSYWLNGTLQWSIEDTAISDGTYVGNRWQGGSNPPQADNFYVEDSSTKSDRTTWYDGTNEVPAMLQGVWDGSNVVKATFDRNS